MHDDELTHVPVEALWVEQAPSLAAAEASIEEWWSWLVGGIRQERRQRAAERLREPRRYDGWLEACEPLTEPQEPSR